jgi:predicted MFS family arabinose efflux permease
MRAMASPASVSESLGAVGREPTSQDNSSHFLLMFAILASVMGTSVGMAQVTASLYAVALGSSKTMLGLIAGAQSVGVLLVSLPIGMLVDRVGPVRPFLAGTMLAGLTYAVVPLVQAPGWLLLCTTLISFFMPLRFVSLNTVFLAQLAALGENKAGWYRGTHMLGMFLVGPALGAQAVSWLGFAWTYRLIALAFVLTLCLSPIVFARYTPPVERRGGNFWSKLGEQLSLLVGDREIRRVSSVELATQATGAFFTFFVIVLAVTGLGLAASEASTLVGLKGISFIVALFALGGVLKRLGRYAYALSFLSIALGLAGVGFARGTVLLWIGSLALGLGLGAVQIATLTEYAKLGSRTGHGRISGMSALVGPSGGIFGNLLGGMLGRWLSLSHIFVLMAAAFAAAAALLGVAQRQDRRQRSLQ